MDNTAPVITLLGAPEVTIEAGATYSDAGATATDTTDGDLTESIITVNPVDTSKLGTYVITFNVTDSANNNASEVSRKVIVQDTSDPVISLKGTAEQSVEAGGTFTDAGATAADSLKATSL